jgi:hypothetical protein
MAPSDDGRGAWVPVRTSLVRDNNRLATPWIVQGNSGHASAQLYIALSGTGTSNVFNVTDTRQYSPTR